MDEHRKILLELFNYIDKNEIKDILDAGSGRTSLNNLIDYFKESKIDAIIYYGDERKKRSIKENVSFNNYILFEKDIVKDKIDKKYDLILAHLLLGEATMWGNNFKTLLDKLLEIETKYLIIVDIKEDPSVDYTYLEQRLNNYRMLGKTEVKKEKPQQFTNFVSRNYIGYIIEK